MANVAACDAGQNTRDSCAIAGFVYRHGVQVPRFNGRSFDADPTAATVAFTKSCNAGAQLACQFAQR